MEFVPIRLDDYVLQFLKNNLGETAEQVTRRLQAALAAYKAGKRCHCGAPIWVIGSAEAGHACFTCITGEANPSGDYELFRGLRSASALGRTRLHFQGQSSIPLK